MFIFSIIGGLAFGLEYGEDPDAGFVLMLHLGLVRITWYKDLVPMDDDEDY